MRVAVPLFPGSNGDHDALHAMGEVLGFDARAVWHKETCLPEGTDFVFIPGGFSFGDYLRCGAIAALSPIMVKIRHFADQGGTVLGVCNGFQVLCEAGLLPGALLLNESLHFIHRRVHVRVERTDLAFTRGLAPGQVLELPIAHAEGRYALEPEALERLEAQGSVVFRYCGADGGLGGDSNPNGSMGSIAGVANAQGNVLGMMPHPERVVEIPQGGTDGLCIFKALWVALGRH